MLWARMTTPKHKLDSDGLPVTEPLPQDQNENKSQDENENSVPVVDDHRFG